VTRNKTDFQGNGLYGTLEICRIGGGKFSLNAGYGVLFTQRQTLTARNETIPYCGTTVDALIDFSEPALLEKALAIDGTIFRPTDYIELKYEQDDQAAIPFILEEQATSFRSRPAGKPVNIKLGNLVRACPGQVVQVDFKQKSAPLKALLKQTKQKSAPKGAFLFDAWRSGRDSNPRPPA
jgi:hypothetical protein